LIGEAVLDELRARKFAFSELHLLDDERHVGRPVTDAEGAADGRAADGARWTNSPGRPWPC